MEIIKAGIDAYNRGDLEAALGHVASDFELDFSRAIGPLRGVYRLDQIGRFQEEMGSVWESIWLEAHEFIEVQDQVVVPWTMHVKGRDEIEVTARVTLTFTFRDGAIVGAVMYQEREEALEAVGLSEEMTLPANVETIRRMVESANASGWDSESVVNDWVHPEGRMYPAPDFPGSDVYVGREGMGAFIREWTSTFDDLRWDLEQLIDLGDRVVVLARMVGKSRTTGTAIDWPFGGVFADFRDGTFAEARFFMDQKGALEAVGLSEEQVSPE